MEEKEKIERAMKLAVSTDIRNEYAHSQDCVFTAWNH